MTVHEDVFDGNSKFKLTLTIASSGNQSPSISGNYTDVPWALRIEKTGYSPTWSNNSSHYWVIVDGSEYSGNFTYDFRNSDTLYLRGGTNRVYHNADGTGRIVARATCTTSNLGYASVPTIDESLPTIPRASEPTMSASSVYAGDSITVLTHRASSSFDHTITYKIGGASGTIATKTSVADVDWTPPMSLLNEMPNTTSGKVTITVTTYSGSTNLGSNNTSFYLKAPSSVVPSFDDILHSEYVTEIANEVGAYVQGMSRLNLAITGAQGRYSSTIKSYSIKLAGTSINSSSGVSDIVSTSGPVSITGKVTDSRGRTASKTIAVNVLPYTPPLINNITFERALVSGTPDNDGTYIRTNFDAAVQSLIVDGIQKNALTYKIYTRERGEISWVLKKSSTPGGVVLDIFDIVGTYSIEQSWEVLVEIWDKFNSSSQQGTIATAAIFMHWGGKAQGLGVGKYWERGAMDVKGLIYQNDGIPINSLKEIPVGTDLDTIVQSGDYVQVTQANASKTLHYPIISAGHLEVRGSLDGIHIYQRYTSLRVNRTIGGTIWSRSLFGTDGYWGPWVRNGGPTNVLWTGALLMGDSQVVSLSELVSEQQLGIVLIWSSGTDTDINNYDFTQDFIPKYMVEIWPGTGRDCIMASGTTMVRKYVYISDDHVTGHANNTQSPQDRRILRAVIGI